MTDAIRLNQTFQQFANFGVTATTKSSGSVTMDNARFAKLCRDCKLLDKNVTTVDVDIFFKKALVKGERRINFEQFQQALQLLAAKKYANDSAGYQKVSAAVAKAAPSTSGTIAETSGIYSKLTDTSLYTGTHKERFDESGKGKGLAGRDPVIKTSDLSQIVGRSSGTAPQTQSQKRTVTVSMEQLSNQGPAKPNSQRPAVFKPTSHKSNQNLAAKPNSQKSNQNLSATSKSNLSSSKSSLNKSNGSVYDRLTNTSQYTGTHKHRFDDSGKGRGLAGRDSVALGNGTAKSYRGGNVHDLSQILRN
jgi:hypothetical protein